MHSWAKTGICLMIARGLSAAVFALEPGTARLGELSSLNGRIEGSLQVNQAGSITLNGGAVITGKLLVPGTPEVRVNGNRLPPPIASGGGAVLPDSHRITLNGNATLGGLVLQQDPQVLPQLSPLGSPHGTRRVVLNRESDAVGEFGDLLDLTLNGNGLIVEVPPGRYGSFTLNGNNRIVLGQGAGNGAGFSEYEFQRLTINGQAGWQLAGPVRISLASSLTWNGGSIAADQPPEWLDLRVLSGDFTLNGSSVLRGYVTAPAARVTINGQSVLEGGLVARALVVNGGGLLRLIEPAGEVNRVPVVEWVHPAPGQVFNAPATLRLRVTVDDPDGDVINSVRFFQDDVFLGAIEAEPFTFEVGPLPVGQYRFRAMASDVKGTTGESGDVVVSVLPLVPWTLPFSSDFEAGESYFLGSLSGQHGWRVEGDAMVSEADAISGNQSVLVGGGGRRSSIRLLFDPVAIDEVVHWMASVLPVAGDGSTVGTTLRLGGIELGFRREASLGVWQATLPGGAAKVIVSPGVELDENGVARQWGQVGIRADYLHREWDLILNGRLAAYGLAMTVDPVPVFAGFAVEGSDGAATVFDRVSVAFSALWFADEDHDGIDDAWEETYGLDRTRNDRVEDLDGDNLTNIEEFLLGLRPDNPDSDGDGLFDGDEQFYGWGALTPSSDEEPPSPPNRLTPETIGVDSVTLSWPAANDNLRVSGYLIYRDGEALDTDEPIRGTTFTDEGLVSGETYFYAVQAFDFAGNVSEITTEIEVTTLAEDGDGDGLSDEWENRFFFEEEADPDEDADGDGMSNLAEFQAGSNPKDFFNGVSPTLNDPYGGAPSPDNTLIIEVRHPDGTPWVGAPVTFMIDEGTRRITANRESGEYATRVRVWANADGLAVVYLEPLNP